MPIVGETFRYGGQATRQRGVRESIEELIYVN